MRARRFLNLYREEMIVILKLERRIEALDDLFSLTQDMTKEKVQTSHEPDKIGEVIGRKDELREELKKEIATAKAMMDEVEDVISKVSDKRLQLLLHERYINFMTWSEIAEDFDLSDRWVQELHGKALNEVNMIINP